MTQADSCACSHMHCECACSDGCCLHWKGFFLCWSPVVPFGMNMTLCPPIIQQIKLLMLWPWCMHRPGSALQIIDRAIDFVIKEGKKPSGPSSSGEHWLAVLGSSGSYCS